MGEQAAQEVQLKSYQAATSWEDSKQESNQFHKMGTKQTYFREV